MVLLDMGQEQQPVGDQDEPGADSAELPDPRGSFLEAGRTRSLNSLAFYVASTFGVSPIEATAICEHIFQELIQQFYELGVCYMPNFGWLEYNQEASHRGGAVQAVLEPSDAMKETLAKMQRAMASPEFSLAAIELKIRNTTAFSGKAISDGQSTRDRLATSNDVSARYADPF